MPDEAPVAVERRDDEQRLVVERDGLVAELTYRLVGHRLELVHDGVPESLEGHGIGSALVREAVAWARHDGLILVPSCPFARRWLLAHRNETAGVEVDWRHPH